MSNAESIGFILTVLFYMLGSVIAYCMTYSELCSAISNAYIGSSIVSKKDEWFVRSNRRQLAYAVAVLWIFFYAFKVWKLIGRTVYDAFIIKDNEEDRIAAWVV